jgi:hypothetical protein
VFGSIHASWVSAFPAGGEPGRGESRDQFAADLGKFKYVERQICVSENLEAVKNHTNSTHGLAIAAILVDVIIRPGHLNTTEVKIR